MDRKCESAEKGGCGERAERSEAARGPRGRPSVARPGGGAVCRRRRFSFSLRLPLPPFWEYGRGQGGTRKIAASPRSASLGPSPGRASLSCFAAHRSSSLGPSPGRASLRSSSLGPSPGRASLRLAQPRSASLRVRSASPSPRPRFARPYPPPLRN